MPWRWPLAAECLNTSWAILRAFRCRRRQAIRRSRAKI